MAENIDPQAFQRKVEKELQYLVEQDTLDLKKQPSYQFPSGTPVGSDSIGAVSGARVTTLVIGLVIVGLLLAAYLGLGLLSFWEFVVLASLTLILALVALSIYNKVRRRWRLRMRQKALRRQQESLQKARQLVTRKDIRVYLCPALKTASGDAFEISKIVTPLLVGLVIAGTPAIPLVPILFASVALVISRMGIASLCADYDKKDEDEK